MPPSQPSARNAAPAFQAQVQVGKYPILREIETRGLPLTVYVQDNPDFPSVSRIVDDRELEHSFHLEIETVPTLIRVADGHETQRVVGWEREESELLKAARR